MVKKAKKLKKANVAKKPKKVSVARACNELTFISLLPKTEPSSGLGLRRDILSSLQNLPAGELYFFEVVPEN